MIALLADARSALIGLARLLAFQEGWRSHFDISPEGVWRSFGAVALALPAFVLFVLAANYFVAANAPGSEAGYSPLEAGISYLRIWAVFPVVAAGVAIALGLTGRYAAWLVIHNWAVFALLHVTALFFLLYAAGIADAAALAVLLQFYRLARLFVHWRIACAALQVGPVTGAAAAGIPVLADMVLIYALS